MKRGPLTARNLRLLQIGGLAVVCLSLVIVSLASGRCSRLGRNEDRQIEPMAEPTPEPLLFNATALQNAFMDAGFAVEGNLYAYTLTPSDGTRLSCAVQLSKTQTQNDTVTLQFSGTPYPQGDEGGFIWQALRDLAVAARPWYALLLDALSAAITEANTGDVPPGLDAMKDGVLLSIDNEKPFSLQAGAFMIDGGYTAAESPSLYVLRVQIRAAGEKKE